MKSLLIRPAPGVSIRYYDRHEPGALVAISRIFGHSKVVIRQPVTDEDLDDVAAFARQIDERARARRVARNRERSTREYWASHGGERVLPRDWTETLRRVR